MARKFDSFQFEKFERTANGYLKIDGIVTRTGVFKYAEGNNLRSVEEVLNPDSLKTMMNIPVTWDHPPDLLTPFTTSLYQKGFVATEPEVISQGPDKYLIKLNDIIITDPSLIYAIENDKDYRQFSLGYDCIEVEKKGVFDSMEYDSMQTKITYNHLAVVKDARCGSVCSVVKKDENTMKLDSKCTCKKGAKMDKEEEKKEDKKMDSDERFASLEEGHKKILEAVAELKAMMSEKKKDSESEKEEESKEFSKKDKKKDEKVGDYEDLDKIAAEEIRSSEKKDSISETMGNFFAGSQSTTAKWRPYSNEEYVKTKLNTF